MPPRTAPAHSWGSAVSAENFSRLGARVEAGIDCTLRGIVRDFLAATSVVRRVEYIGP